jgi:protein involved in polysaccharide export with SLBB domain
MDRALTPPRGLARLSALALPMILVAGCSSTSVRTDLDLGRPHDDAGSIGDLMSTQDHRALTTLASTRAQQGRDGYRIGADDLLDIRIPKLLTVQSDTTRAANSGAAIPSVAEAPVFQQGVRVSADGEVTLPLIGNVHAAGRTPSELEAEIARRLVAGGILLRPDVSVQIAEHRSSVVAVMGSVERPGLYPLTRPGATIAEFIWAAGGPNKDAGRLVEFTPARGLDAHGPPIRIDLDVLTKDRSATPNDLNPVALAGDVLTVAPAGSVQIDGWVDKPGSYPVTRGLTLTGAVAAAGGHLFPADRQHVTVKRVLAAGEQKYFSVDLDAVASGREPDFPITDGDVVHLPASPERAVPWGVYEATKEMIHVGASIPIF